MNLYSIKICSSGDGWSENITADGEVTQCDGAFTIKYFIDGDECILSVKDNKVTQERRGSQCIKIMFEEGRRTQCIIGNGEFSGSFEIHTRSLKFISGSGGFRLLLEYTSGTDEELIKLAFTAIKKPQP